MLRNSIRQVVRERKFSAQWQQTKINNASDHADAHASPRALQKARFKKSSQSCAEVHCNFTQTCAEVHS